MEHSNRDQLAQWIAGNETAATTVVDCYQQRLVRLADRLLSPQLKRRVDGDEVAGSAWRSFFLAVRDKAVAIPQHDDLWPLLSSIVARKVNRQADIHLAARRNVTREKTCADIHSLPEKAEASHVVELELILSGLSFRDQQIVRQSLQGYEQTEIATQLGCSERTVRRVLHRLKLEWHGSRFQYGDLLLLEFVGQGTIAKVYRARNRLDGSDVAVKFLKKPFWCHQQAVQSILAEATVAASVHDANLVQHRGWGTTRPGGLFLVMEWIEGVTVDEWFATPQPTNELWQMAHDVAQGLVAMHDAGMVHGDLSPRNVMRRADGRYVIVDLGFARKLGQTTAYGGTPGFTAPEVLAGEPADVRADLYSWAALLKHCQQHVENADLLDIVQRCLSHEVRTRPSSAKELTMVLE